MVARGTNALTVFMFPRSPSVPTWLERVCENESESERESVSVREGVESGVEGVVSKV